MWRGFTSPSINMIKIGGTRRQPQDLARRWRALTHELVERKLRRHAGNPCRKPAEPAGWTQPLAVEVNASAIRNSGLREAFTGLLLQSGWLGGHWYCSTSIWRVHLSVPPRDNAVVAGSPASVDRATAKPTAGNPNVPSGVHVSPPSLEKSDPVGPTATSFAGLSPAHRQRRNDSQRRAGPAGIVQVRPPSEVFAATRVACSGAL